MQNLIGWCDDIRPFPIGSYYCDGRFVRYEDIADVPAPMQDDQRVLTGGLLTQNPGWTDSTDFD